VIVSEESVLGVGIAIMAMVVPMLVSGVWALLAAGARQRPDLVEALRPVVDAWRPIERHEAWWQARAAELGLAVRSGEDGRYSLAGELRGFDVAILPLDQYGARLAIAVGGRGRWPLTFHHGDTVHVADQPLPSLLPASGSGYSFVARGREGDEAATLAVLDPATVAALDAARALIARRRRQLVVAHGAVIATFGQGPRKLARELPALLDAMLALASALDRRGRSVPRCLADGLGTAGIPERRDRLRILVTRYLHDPATRAACEAALGDDDPETRRWAAMGAGGPRALAALRDLALTRSSSWPLRCEALALWSQRAPLTSESTEVIRSLVEDADGEVRRAALAAGRRVAARLPAATLARRAEAASGDEALDLAALIVATRPEGAEASLLTLLRSARRDVREEALRGLRDVGSPAALPAVQSLARGALAPPETKLLAREAAAAILSRMGIVEPGRLSLGADDAGGALDAPDRAAEPGRLSAGPADSGSLASSDDADGDDQRDRAR
jgi:hypothetical protein